ncbi:ornithine decarboxylase-like isoform X2 [Ischnura elegans]|uniref:ornithine decarboxylase-like isoform X2 n=1 Tax=Ischnura elegans TaxID=197161 RepID=UPI001ED87532|nr:ornithine decarboxylase-like isoform X2 [Ischnura elegans]
MSAASRKGYAFMFHEIYGRPSILWQFSLILKIKVSWVEMTQVLKMGVDSNRIIFANPAKPASHIRHAASLGVQLMTFDNEVELHKIRTLYSTARVVLRIRCDSEVAQCPLGMKFGCEATMEAPRLLALAKSLGLHVEGISFHVGSGCGDPPVFRRAIARARALFDHAESTLGMKLTLLDIGGGFPGNKGSSIDDIADVVNGALDEFFPDGCGVHVIAEPGRFFVASAYTLATHIHSLREPPPQSPSILPPSVAESLSSSRNSLPEKNEVAGKEGEKITKQQPSIMYYINDGVYGSFGNLLYDHAHVTPIPLKPVNSGSKLILSSIWGPTCDGLDCVCEEALLPRLTVGDWIVFEDMGAYTLVSAGPFNGFPVPNVLTVSSEAVKQMLENKLPITGELFEKVLDIPLYSTMGNAWPSFYGESDLIFCGKGGKQDPEWKPEGILEKVGNDSLAQGENDSINGNRAAKGGPCVVGLGRGVVGTDGGLESHHVHLHHLSLPSSGLPIQLVEVSPVVN